MWLLNHSEEGQHPPGSRRRRRYGLKVQDALFLAWHAANRICSKRLIPEVAHEAFISLTPGHSLRDLTDSFCQQAGFRPQIVFESDEPSTIRGLIRAE